MNRMMAYPVTFASFVCRELRLDYRFFNLRIHAVKPIFIVEREKRTFTYLEFERMGIRATVAYSAILFRL
jgi:hypothetical protein